MSEVRSIGQSVEPLNLEAVVRRASADYVYVIDLKGMLRDCNDRFAGEYGSGGDSCLSKSLATWMSGDEFKFAQRMWNRLSMTNKSERCTRRMKNGNGHLRILDIYETPVAVNGHLAAILGVGRDITEEALLEDQLWETQESRDSAVEYAVRASLGLIKGYIYSMRGSNQLGSSQREKFGRVVMDEIEALSRTIENLLSARGLREDSLMPAELCDVKSLMTAAMASVESEAQRRSIEIFREEPGERVEMYVPEIALIRLLQNLLEFCVMRITHSGRIQVTIQDSGEYIDIQISDNGSSLSEEHLHSLFVHRTVKSGDGDSAMESRTALYVARLFADAMGGAVTARSSSSGGLEFHLMLPRQTSGFTSAHSGAGLESDRTSAMSMQ